MFERKREKISKKKFSSSIGNEAILIFKSPNIQVNFHINLTEIGSTAESESVESRYMYPYSNNYNNNRLQTMSFQNKLALLRKRQQQQQQLLRNQMLLNKKYANFATSANGGGDNSDMDFNPNPMDYYDTYII